MAAASLPIHAAVLPFVRVSLLPHQPAGPGRPMGRAHSSGVICERKRNERERNSH